MTDRPHNVLITGATGFIGRALLARVGADDRYRVRAAARRPDGDSSATTGTVLVADVGPLTDWSGAVAGVRTVIHAAGRAHVMPDGAGALLREYRRVNVEGTLQLARCAAAAGARRFVFLSSIKVNGEATLPGRPFRAEDGPAPADPYAVSKHDAEQGLAVIAAESGMELVTLRPPLVYGPGVRANFLKLMQWLHRGLPLPLGAIHNRRTLVALDNLVDLVVTCIDHPAAANQLFLVGDAEDLSTSDLARRLARALGTSAHLLPVPQSLIAFGARLVGKRAAADRLCGSLQADISKTRSLLGWTPPVGVDVALDATAAHFLRATRE